MDLYYFDSPHKQITEDFEARVVDVHDGDTIRVEWNERDFTFPIRFSEIAAPELDEGGSTAQKWLKARIDGKIVQVEIDFFNRVGKYGRILGNIWESGISINQEMLDLGLVVPFGSEDDSSSTF